MLRIAFLLLLAGCMPYTRDPFLITQICPYPYPTTLVAEQYVDYVFEVDGHQMAVTCSNSPYVVLLGCTIPVRDIDNPTEISGYWIYISAVANRSEKKAIYYHELCHVYEIEVLDLPEASSRHEGWIQV